MSVDWRPVVTIVVPMLDEIDHIDECLAGMAAQTYPHDLLDVVVVDGGSTDGSRQRVDELASASSWLRIVDNPRRSAAAAFNIGTSAAKGDVVCLFSAHGVPARTYVERSVEILAETGAAGAGGRYDHVGRDRRSAAIGLAMASPFGMASPHRFATERRSVDTISHPAYRRVVMCDVGPFDETLMRNSDYEFNHRLLQHGDELVFDPSIGSIYRPRPSLRALGRQFWWYGRWKAEVIARHPSSMRARHLLPPIVVAAAVLTPAAATTSRAGRRWAALGWGAYLLGVLGACTMARPSERDADPVVLAAAFPVMHASWGAGFLRTALRRA